MTISTSEALEHLGLVDGTDFRCVDHSDGNGPQVVWLSRRGRPSVEEITAAATELEARPKLPASLAVRVAALEERIAALEATGVS